MQLGADEALARNAIGKNIQRRCVSQFYTQPRAIFEPVHVAQTCRRQRADARDRRRHIARAIKAPSMGGP